MTWSLLLQWLHYSIIARSHRRHGQSKNWLVLSCPCRRCENDNWRQDKTVLSCLDPVSMSFVSSQPSFQFAKSVQSQIYWGLLEAWKLETGSSEDETQVFCFVCSCVHTADKTRQSCFIRGVNKLLKFQLNVDHTVTYDIILLILLLVVLVRPKFFKQRFVLNVCFKRLRFFYF